MLTIFEWANKIYTEQPEVWQQLVAQAMAQDFSWDKSAVEYMAVYDKLM